MASQFPHHIKTVVIALFHPLLGHLKHVVVISTCKPFITCDDNKALCPVCSLDLASGIKVKMLHIRHMAQDTAD